MIDVQVRCDVFGGFILAMKIANAVVAMNMGRIYADTVKPCAACFSVYPEIHSVTVIRISPKVATNSLNAIIRVLLESLPFDAFTSIYLDFLPFNLVLLAKNRIPKNETQNHAQRQ